MIQIKSIKGNVLYECSCNTHKEALEKAVRDNVDLSFANLSGLDLHGANLKGANLQIAHLSHSNLFKADLTEANLEAADFSYTNCKTTIFRKANLKNICFEGATAHYSCFAMADLTEAYCDNANFRHSTFNCADLTSASFEASDLYGAEFNCAHLYNINFKDANLRDAFLLRAKNVPYIPLACPSEGSFIGWKRVIQYLIKLKIPEDAKRSSATSNKCRCDKAKVLAITDFEEKTSFTRIVNTRYIRCVYEVGKMVYPDCFDEDRWNECSHGIHFFINKQDAINYWV